MPDAAPDRSARAAELAAAVLAHPGVARLDGGPFGTVASHLPGRRRILGVRIGVGPVAVEVTFSDVVAAAAPVRNGPDRS
jgi:hypothetical protein